MTALVQIVHPSDVVRLGLQAVLNNLPGLQVLVHRDFGTVCTDFYSKNLILFDLSLIQDFDELKRTFCITKLDGVAIAIDGQKMTHGIANISINTSEQKVKELVAELLELNIKSKPKLDQNSLTDREIDILKCVAKGLSNKEIADFLHISIHTVITHRKNITSKLGIKSASGLTIYAILEGLVNPGDITLG